MLKTWASVSLSVVLLAFALSGCAASSKPSGYFPLRFTYTRIAKPGYIDQTVTIANPSFDLAAIPTLSFQALDANSNPLTSVTVTTVYGSDRGLVVAPAGYKVFDILRFHGEGVGRVRDVKVTIKRLRTVKDGGMTYPHLDWLDAHGRSVDYLSDARSVRVTNPGQSDYAVRLVGIRWNFPPAGQSQQAEAVTAVGRPVEVAAGGHTDAPVTPAVARQYDVVKGYISVK